MASKFPSQKSGALKGVTIWEPATTVSITIGATGYATFSSFDAIDFEESGVEAFYATQEGNNVNFNNVITNPAAKTGLLLKAPEGSYTAIVTETGTDVSAENKLQACLEDKIVGTTEGCDYGKVFILANHNGVVGFYRSDNGRTLTAGTSYLYLTVSEARATIGFPLDCTTGIMNLQNPVEKVYGTEVFDLQGRRVSCAEQNSSLKNGLYIVQGKKIVKK